MTVKYEHTKKEGEREFISLPLEGCSNGYL